MKPFLIIISLFLSTSIKAHDVPVATFDLSLKDGVIELKMEFDKADLDYVLDKKASHSKQVLDSNLKIEKYILQHLKWVINGENIVTRIDKISSDGHHYTIKATLQGFEGAIKTIEVYNTCLIDDVTDHSNVIYAHFYGKTRGFRLHKGRKMTVIEYLND